MSKNRSHSNYAKKNPKMIDRGFGIKMTDEQWEYFMRPFNCIRNYKDENIQTLLHFWNTVYASQIREQYINQPYQSK